MNNRDEYMEKMKAQLDQWERQTVMWEAAAREATSEAKMELEKQVGIMKSRGADEARQAGGERDSNPRYPCRHNRIRVDPVGTVILRIGIL